ncbi:hypothetical protein J2847_004089 [Azospirillum agricola]|uniref:hypothetical protein n=1 Tax=Azospirillum agricola TaxID=1720247 RepID=UPI001AE829DD|nr:hypothetical protein [Azospirillum agricola]MBP2230780.1 hypothetical protein [Azospirillum agricola]
MSATLNTDVTGRDDLSAARYLVATPQGLLLVQGCVFGDFGIHPDGGDVALVHLPTGRTLGRFDDLQHAYTAMAEVGRGFGRA